MNTAGRTSSALGRQVATAVRWNALLPVKVAASSAAALAMANVLTKQDYGIVILITSLAALLGTWIDLGIERSLPKFYPEVERTAGRAGLTRFMREITLFKLGVVLLVILGMVLTRDWFFAFWASRTTDPAVLQQLDSQRWLLFGALIALLALGSVFDVLMQVLVAFFQQKQFNIINLATSIAQPLLLVGAVVFSLGVPGIIAVLVCVPLVSIVMAWGTARATIASVEHTTGTGLRPDFHRRLGRHALTSYGLQFAGQLHSFQFAVFFVGGLASVGEFRLGYFLPAQVLQILFSPLNGIQVPLFARLREAHDTARMEEVYLLLTRFLLMVLCPAAIGLALLAQNLTNLLWPQYTDAAPVAIIMAVCLFTGSALAVARNILMVHEVYRPIIVSRALSAVSVPLLFWLPPLYGPVGAAIAIGGASLLAEIVAWVWAMRRLRLTFPWQFAGRVLGASSVMALVVWPAATWLLPVPTTLSAIERAGPALFSQLAIAAIGGLAYLATFRVLGGLDPADAAAVTALRLPGTRYLLRVLS